MSSLDNHNTQKRSFNVSGLETDSRKRSHMESGLRVMNNNSNKPSSQQKQKANFPTQAEIEAFQSQLTSEAIKKLAQNLNENKLSSTATTICMQKFRQCLNDEFKYKPVADALVIALYNRFRAVKPKEGGEGIQLQEEMDIVDFLLGMNLLSRTTTDKKIKLMFELCDHDDDGCMNPVHILQMLQRVERVFAREVSRVDLKSQVLINATADKRAEHNFHFIMTIIREQAIKKLWKQHLKKQLEEEQKTGQMNSAGANSGSAQADALSKKEAKAKAAANAPPIDISSVTQDEDNLITYREFVSALRSLKDTLYKKILPRTLSFADVLSSQPIEEEFRVSDLHVDDFYMLRYELQTIFKKHMFEDEKKNENFLLGKHPLSKLQGQPVKEVFQNNKGKGDQTKQGDSAKEEMLKKCQEIYQQPGVIISEESALKKSSNISKDIKYGYPQDTIYKRKKQEQRAGINMTVSFGKEKTQAGSGLGSILKPYQKNSSNKGKPDPQQLDVERQRIESLMKEQLDVHTEHENANKIDFKSLYQDNLPPEALDLKEFVDKFKDKDPSKDKDIGQIKENAFDKLERVYKLLPPSDHVTAFMMSSL